jgi:hypothetical protein
MCPVVVVVPLLSLFPDFDDTITWDAYETYIIYCPSMESMCLLIFITYLLLYNLIFYQ